MPTFFLLLDNNFTPNDLQNLYAQLYRFGKPLLTEVARLPKGALVALMTFGQSLCVYETALAGRACAEVHKPITARLLVLLPLILNCNRS